MNGRTEPQTRTSLLYQQARRHHQMGELGDAVTLYGKVLVARPRHTPTLLYLSEIAWQTGNLDQAVVLLSRALVVDPQYVEAHELLWQVYKAQGDFEATARVLRRLIEIRRHNGYNYYHLAQLQQERGYLEEARQLFEQSIRYKTDDARIIAAYGELLQLLGRLEEAAVKYQHALLYDPRNAVYHSRLGYLLTLCGQIQEGLVHIERAILLAPDNAMIRHLYWQVLLKTGHLNEGFAAAERSGGLPGQTIIQPSQGKIPQWQGAEFAGRLLLQSSADIEDVLQFARYLPQTKSRCDKLILALPKSLMKLFSNLHCVDEIIEASPASIAAIGADMTVSIGRLPHLFGATLDSIPSHTPYLFADPFLTHSWVRRLNWKSFRVGLVWSLPNESGSNPSAIRSIPVSSIEQLTKLSGISWYSMQFEPDVQPIKNSYSLPIVDCTGGLRDYADMAALAANMDLIIAIDSPVAHLAAALGRPVWMLLPFESNWRWLHRREDSPWYPTMRLFRQNQPGDWDTVIQRVADALGPQSRPFRQFQPLQGKPREFFAETAVTY